MGTEPQRPPLGLVALVALGINGIVGVGIFLAPTTVAAAVPGTAGALVYLAIALGCLPIAFVYARLARALPHDGGPTLYAERAFGPRVARGVGVLIWVSALFSTSAVTRALAEIVARATSNRIPIGVVAVALVVAFVLVNLRGLQLSAWAWTLLTALKLLPLVAVGALGAVAANVITHENRYDHASPASLGGALLAVLFALQGFEIVPLPAGQARDPERTVPRATVASLLGAGVLYAVIHLGCARALPALSTTAEPIVAAARALGGGTLAKLVGAGVVASTLGIVVGMHAMTPRYLTAVVRPGEARPVHVPSIVASAALVAPLAALGSLSVLVDLSSVAVLTQYAGAALSLGVLARRRAHGLAARDLWPVIPSLAVVAVLLAQTHLRDLLVAAGISVIGAFVASRLARSPASPPQG